MQVQVPEPKEDDQTRSEPIRSDFDEDFAWRGLCGLCVADCGCFLTELAHGDVHACVVMQGWMKIIPQQHRSIS